jgi:hypothetical protein
VKFYLVAGGKEQAEQMFTAPRKPRVLLSYYYWKGANKATYLTGEIEGKGYDLFADSGAYSAWSLNDPIDVSGYADWLDRFGHLFTHCANLDVKGDVDAGLKNQRYLEDRGLKPVPVFHAGEPWSVLSDFIEEYPFIALGNLAGATANNKQILAFLVRCFKLALGPDGKARTVYHGFGTTDLIFSAALPWYSGDSSSWGAGARFGRAQIWDSKAAKFRVFNRNDLRTAKGSVAPFGVLGYGPRAFLERTFPTLKAERRAYAWLSVLAYVQAEEWLTRRFGEIEVPARG